MAVQLKPLRSQVILITGASSGIGRVTAKHAAQAGAKVVLVARNEEALQTVVAEIQADGGEAVYAVADVADIEQFKAAADSGTTAFGRIDTWVNNAGVGMFTDITKNTEVDDRKLFETNFWGIVNGSRLAVQYLRDNGGALINVGSEVSDMAVPVQGMYSASKHAILGFTDAFRMELAKAEVPISVTLIKPAAIDTPFAKHAQNNTDRATTLPAPVYAPELVADQILHAAEHPARELYVGGGGRLMVLLGQHFPTLADWFVGKFMPGQQFKDEPADHSNEALHGVGGGAYEERGGLKGEHLVRERSLYGIVSRHPVATTVAVGAVGAAVAYLLLREHDHPLTTTGKVKKAVRDYADEPIARVKKAVKAYAAEPVAQVKKAAAGYAADARKAATDYASGVKAAATGYAADAKDAATDRTSDAADQVHDALHEHVIKPAEKLVATARKRIEELLGR